MVVDEEEVPGDDAYGEVAEAEGVYMYGSIVQHTKPPVPKTAYSPGVNPCRISPTALSRLHHGP